MKAYLTNYLIKKQENMNVLCYIATQNDKKE